MVTTSATLLCSKSFGLYTALAASGMALEPLSHWTAMISEPGLERAGSVWVSGAARLHGEVAGLRYDGMAPPGASALVFEQYSCCALVWLFLYVCIYDSSLRKDASHIEGSKYSPIFSLQAYRSCLGLPRALGDTLPPSQTPLLGTAPGS